MPSCNTSRSGPPLHNKLNNMPVGMPGLVCRPAGGACGPQAVAAQVALVGRVAHAGTMTPLAQHVVVCV